MYNKASNQNLSQNRPPISRYSDLKTIFKFSKTKKSNSKKYPLKFQKIKNIYKDASNQKVLYNRPPPKVGILIQKNNFEIFKNLKSNSKKTP